jgi:hypothetical protein
MRTGLAAVNSKHPLETPPHRCFALRAPVCRDRNKAYPSRVLEPRFDARQIETFKGEDRRIWQASQSAGAASPPNRS